MQTWHPAETAPRDRRILAYGRLGFGDKPEIGTVKWEGEYFVCDPNEATEYLPEKCKIEAWMELPAAPGFRANDPRELSGVVVNSSTGADPTP